MNRVATTPTPVPASVSARMSQRNRFRVDRNRVSAWLSGSPSVGWVAYDSSPGDPLESSGRGACVVRLGTSVLDIQGSLGRRILAPSRDLRQYGAMLIPCCEWRFRAAVAWDQAPNEPSHKPHTCNSIATDCPAAGPPVLLKRNSGMVLAGLTPQSHSAAPQFS